MCSNYFKCPNDLEKVEAVVMMSSSHLLPALQQSLTSPQTLFWIVLLPDQVQVASAMDSQQPLYHLHRAAIDGPWGWKGVWGGEDQHTDVLLWVPLLLGQEASEKKDIFNF